MKVLLYYIIKLVGFELKCKAMSFSGNFLSRLHYFSTLKDKDINIKMVAFNMMFTNSSWYGRKFFEAVVISDKYCFSRFFFLPQ